MRRANQFRCAAKLGPGSSCRYFRDRFAAPHQRPGKALEAWTGFSADGLAGEHGLIEENISLGQLNVRSDDATE